MLCFFSRVSRTFSARAIPPSPPLAQTSERANSQLLSREYRLDRSSYELGSLADRGEGKAGEKVLTVYFQMDSGETLEEYFREYTVGEDGENRITYFRHE